MSDDADGTAPAPQSPRRPGWLLVLVVLLACIAAPALLYETLRRADDEMNTAILGAAQNEAQLIASALTPLLMRDDARAVGEIDAAARGLAGHGRTLRVIRGARRDHADAAFLVAAHPAVADGDFAAIRAKLEASVTAGLDRQRCTGNTRLAERLEAPGGTPEILAAATLVPAGGHCWTVLIGWTAAPLIASSIGRPYWQTPEVRRGAVILGAMIAVVLGALLLAWRSLRLAHAASIARPPGPERALAPPAARIESDGAALAVARELREAAEASLHAARAPLAALGCSLEPLRDGLRSSDTRALAALDVATRSVDRLGRLLDGDASLDGYRADLAAPRRELVDLRKRVADMVFDYHAESASRGLSLSYEALQATPICGAPRLVDAVITTVIDDALQASQAGDMLRIAVQADAASGEARLVVEAPDRHRLGEDPGLRLERTGPVAATPPAPAPLWLARRHMTAMGGTLEATRRADGAAVLVARWPLVEAPVLAPVDSITRSD